MSIKNRLMTYAEVLEHESMKKHSTFRIGGCVDYYIYPKNCTALMCVLEILAQENIPYYVLGRGSNILCSDTDFHGAIINLDRTLNDFYFEPDGVLVAQAGCSIINMATEAMKRSLTGFEWASGIPGSIGGCLYMNAGAYKDNIANHLIDVCVLKDNTICWMKKDELDYAYRHSIFQSHKDWTILVGRFQLEKGNQSDIRDLMNSRRERRMSAQPLDKPCAGSVFRNPEEIPAWKLIENLGLRGHKIGGGLYMNAGAYKDNLANHLIDVCVLKDNTICWMKKDELDYAYRHSIFQSHKDWTILVGRFQLEKGNQNDIRYLMDSRRERRMSAQPLDKPCAGSVFRNPEEIPAWKLIEELGLRGYKIGGAMVSEKHCNFIVNDDLNATAQDVRDLIHEIKIRAKKEYNIDMVTEVEQLYW